MSPVSFGFLSKQPAKQGTLMEDPPFYDQKGPNTYDYFALSGLITENRSETPKETQKMIFWRL